MSDREELEALRRLAELEAKAGGTPQPASANAAPAAPERSLGDSLVRQLGLTARAAGPVGAGALAGAGMGSVLPGVGTVAGAGAGGLAMTLLQLVDQMGGTNYIEQAMDKLGVPKPESTSERVAGGTARTMASMGGIGGGAAALAPAATGTSKAILGQLGANPQTQAIAAVGGGLAGETARESGAGPVGQMAASMAGAIAGPGAIAATKVGAKQVTDAISTIGAAFGSDKGVERLARDAAQRFAGAERERIVSALRSAKEVVPGAKPTVAEALASKQIGEPEQFGGALIRLQKDLSGAKGIEDVLPSAVRRQNVAIKDHIERVKEAARPVREAALEQANRSGRLNVGDITNRIDTQLGTPGFRASDVVVKTLGGVKDKLQSLADDQGRIDANDLYTVRKEIGTVIGKFSKETANWDKRLSARLERTLQEYIDDAIENAGGSGWKGYLKTYSEGLKAAEQHEIIRGEAKRIAAGVKGQRPMEMASEELPKVPTLLHRPMMFVNFGLRTIGKDANDPLVKRLATDLQDPEKFAALLSRPLTDPKRIKAAEIWSRAATVGALAAQSETAQ